MRKCLVFISTWILFGSFLITNSPLQATAATTLTTCTSIKTSVQSLSKDGKCNERIYEARTWYQKGSAPSGTPGSIALDMATCIRKSSGLQIIRTHLTCNSINTTTALWQRPLGPSIAPSITSVVMGLLGTATLNISPPSEDGGARVTSYLVTSNPVAVAATYTPEQIKAAIITGLTPGITYSFSVVAINIKGPSPSSLASVSALALTIPGAPVITKVIATGTNSAQLSFIAPLDNGGLTITSYVATSNPGSLQTTVYQSDSGTINITNLSHSTSYTFTLKAKNIAGYSLASAISPSITTATPPPPPEPVVAPTPTPALAAPAFTLSSSSETRTVNTVATGFTINSTGGAIANFGISATPAGMSFSTITGALTGTPTSVAGATAYTITATNASGSMTRTFLLTVSAVTCANGGTCIVGDRGPGGGIVFYFNDAGFTCGPTLTAICKYLEAAPTSGTSSWTDTQYIWSADLDHPVRTADVIGSGFKNTLAIVAQNPTALNAGTVSQAYRGPNSLTDWYLPSKWELYELFLQSASVGGFVTDYYWSSSHGPLVDFAAWWQAFPPGFSRGLIDKNEAFFVRPIRAFAVGAPAFTLSSSSETLTVNTVATGFTINSTGGSITSFGISTTPAGMSFNTTTGELTGTPTSAAVATAYTITATNVTGFATATFTLTVNLATQATLSITSLTTNTKTYSQLSNSQALSITTSGGSGTSAITFAIAAGGSASGCTLSGRTATETITATTAGTCLIRASKAADSNYTLATSATSTFTFDKATPTLQPSVGFVTTFKNSDVGTFDLGNPEVVGGLVGTFTFTSSNLLVATISGKTVTVLRGGVTIITATFTPTDTTNYSIATIPMTLTVYQILGIGDGPG
jgi:hypothetical protein